MTYDINTLDYIRRVVAADPRMLDTAKRSFPGAWEQLEQLYPAAPAPTAAPADPAAGLLPAALGVSRRFNEAMKGTLPPEEYDKFMKYVANGCPGIEDLAKAGRFNPLLELLWETLKEGIPSETKTPA